MSKKHKNIIDCTWNSLAQLKEHFEKEKTENVIDFNGVVLETKTAYYTLAFGRLNRVIK